MASSICSLNNGTLLQIFSSLSKEHLSNTALVSKRFFEVASNKDGSPEVAESDNLRTANIKVSKENCEFLKQFNISEKFKTPMNVFSAERLIIEELKRKVQDGELDLDTAIATELKSGISTIEHIRLLIEIGAPVDVFSFYDAFCNNVSTEIVKLLLNKEPRMDENYLLLALNNNVSTETVQFLFEKGAHIDKHSLTIALSRNAPIETIKLIVENGAQIDESVIKLAKTKNVSPEILEFLLSRIHNG